VKAPPRICDAAVERRIGIDHCLSGRDGGGRHLRDPDPGVDADDDCVYKLHISPCGLTGLAGVTGGTRSPRDSFQPRRTNALNPTESASGSTHLRPCLLEYGAYLLLDWRASATATTPIASPKTMCPIKLCHAIVSN